MEQDANAPHLTEESPSYNSERSDCLNHGFGRPDVASDREEGRHGADGINWGSGLVLAEPLALQGFHISNTITAISIASIYTSPANMEGGCLTMAGIFVSLVAGGFTGENYGPVPIGLAYDSYTLIRKNYHAML